MGVGGLEHREPSFGGFVDEQRPDLGGEADSSGCAGGELFGVDESFGDPPVQGRGCYLAILRLVLKPSGPERGPSSCGISRSFSALVRSR